MSRWWDSLLVNVERVKEGCIISKDVFSKTNSPIIKEKTVVMQKHLNVLKAFLINEVEIESVLVTGEQVTSLETRNIEEETENFRENKDDFIRMFLQSTKKYEVEFQKWQSGMQVDVTKIRSLFIPLIEVMEETNANVFSLHHYSTKDNYLYHHAIAVGLLSSYIARKLNYPKGDVLQIGFAGCLANCGMAKINKKILQKKTSLTREEFEEIKQHPIHSFKMLEKTPFLKDESKLAVYQHHERLNGSGYPLGEKGNKIHPYAKIIAVADVFHAMTSERLYKSKQSPFKVLEMMLEDHFGQFDIASIQSLSSAIMNFSIGTNVQLSDGRIAEIVFIDQKHPARPLIKLKDTEEIIHLERERQVYIQKIINQK